jgi:hypothetical protein
MQFNAGLYYLKWRYGNVNDNTSTREMIIVGKFYELLNNIKSS